MHSTKSENLFAFTLGRESKLSLAELISLFGANALENYSDDIAIFSLPQSDSEINAIFRNIGGSIRVIRLIGETDEKKFPTDVIRELGSSKVRRFEGSDHQPTNLLTHQPTKITFALGVYGGEYRLSDIGLRIKKTLQESGHSARLVNIENKNIVSAVWKKEKLGKSLSEYNLIHIKGLSYLGVTLSCQDIDAYTKRDTSKSRDMVVGMMPPKLAQMMINLAISNPNYPTIRLSDYPTIYDPFCGLGTILIEAANMGITKIYGSDLSAKMVHATEKSLKDFIAEEKVWHERIKLAGGTPAKDFSNFTSEIWEMDASKIGSSKVRWLDASDNQPTNRPTDQPTIHIVSEGYLGEIMHKDSITQDRVKQEKAKLKIMYDGFFGGLAQVNFSGNIVMTFPFWDVHGTLLFFTEIYDVIGRHGFDIVPLLPENMRTMMTPKGSLLYKRPEQNVGREVIKIAHRNILQ